MNDAIQEMLDRLGDAQANVREVRRTLEAMGESLLASDLAVYEETLVGIEMEIERLGEEE